MTEEERSRERERTKIERQGKRERERMRVAEQGSRREGERGSAGGREREK